MQLPLGFQITKPLKCLYHLKYTLISINLGLKFWTMFLIFYFNVQLCRHLPAQIFDCISASVLLNQSLLAQKSPWHSRHFFFLLKTKNTFWTIFWSSFLMCDSAAIYQLRFATASERRFCLAVVAKPCKIIAQQSRSWIFTLQFFEVKLRWFLTPSSANSAQLYSFCFPPLKQWGQPIYKISFL